MKFELKYTVVTKGHLLRIDVNDQHIITQLTYIPDEFKKLGFLSEKEIINDVSSYVRKVQEEGLSLDFKLDMHENYRGVTANAQLVGSNKKGESATIKNVTLIHQPGNDPGYDVIYRLEDEVYEIFNKTK